MTTIKYERNKEFPQIVYMTLNRPEKSNALDGMTQEIKYAMDIVMKTLIRRWLYLGALGKPFRNRVTLMEFLRKP